MPETSGSPVEKQSKAFHSTEQMVNNHVKVRMRDDFSPQHILFLKIGTGFFVLWAALPCHVCFPALISAWSFLEERGWFSYWQPAKWMQMWFELWLFMNYLELQLIQRRAGWDSYLASHIKFSKEIQGLSWGMTRNTALANTVLSCLKCHHR